MSEHKIRIRTVTCFVELPPWSPGAEMTELWGPGIARAATFVLFAGREISSRTGLEVQTVRIATQPWERYVDADHACDAMRAIERLCAENGVTFVAMGPAVTLQGLRAAARMAAASTISSVSYDLGPGGDAKAAQEGAGVAAQAVLDVADASGGQGNFRFAVACNVPPCTPFFPVSYCGPGDGCSFAIGFENDAIVADALEGASGDLAKASEKLADAFLSAVGPADTVCREIAEFSRWVYNGVDASVAPGLDTPDLTAAAEALGLGRFGSSGSLSVSALVTGAIKSLAGCGMKLCGYSGLMLPILEDRGLARASVEGTISVQKILLCSAVCGTGLDTVPIPGRVSGNTPDVARRNSELEKGIAALLLDTWSMAYRLSKPLSCRLLPVPGADAGDPVDFGSPYMVPGAAMDPWS